MPLQPTMVEISLPWFREIEGNAMRNTLGAPVNPSANQSIIRLIPWVQSLRPSETSRMSSCGSKVGLHISIGPRQCQTRDVVGGDPPPETRDARRLCKSKQVSTGVSEMWRLFSLSTLFLVLPSTTLKGPNRLGGENTKFVHVESRTRGAGTGRLANYYGDSLQMHRIVS